MLPVEVIVRSNLILNNSLLIIHTGSEDEAVTELSATAGCAIQNQRDSKDLDDQLICSCARALKRFLRSNLPCESIRV
jgi:hypothetical protein